MVHCAPLRHSVADRPASTSAAPVSDPAQATLGAAIVNVGIDEIINPRLRDASRS